MMDENLSYVVKKNWVWPKPVIIASGFSNLTLWLRAKHTKNQTHWHSYSWLLCLLAGDFKQFTLLNKIVHEEAINTIIDLVC